MNLDTIITFRLEDAFTTLIAVGTWWIVITIALSLLTSWTSVFDDNVEHLKDLFRISGYKTPKLKSVFSALAVTGFKWSYWITLSYVSIKFNLVVVTIIVVALYKSFRLWFWWRQERAASIPAETTSKDNASLGS